MRDIFSFFVVSAKAKSKFTEFLYKFFCIDIFSSNYAHIIY